MEEITFFGHFGQKIVVFSKKISFSRYIFSMFQTILSHMGPIPGDFFFKVSLQNLFQILPKSKVTIAHVHAFFSLKLNAIIIFEIHIYSVP